LTVDQTEHANPRHQQAAATRQQLLDAAGAVFERRGYRATTVGAITDRASTAHGTFYLYFRNKEDAFCQVIESVIVDELALAADMPAELADHDHRAAIEQGIRNFLSVYHRHDGLWRALLEGMLQSARVQELWLGLRRQFVMRLSDSFDDQQRSAGLRPFDATMVAHALTAMTEWSAFTHLVLHEPAPGADPDVESLVATLADLWYRSLYGTVADDAATEGAVAGGAVAGGAVAGGAGAGGAGAGSPVAGGAVAE
jgi:AcrR family transcriptional regulator